eukprot:SAG11_NODE_5074_length_1672_cov_1.787031_3_plen_101_part_00
MMPTQVQRACERMREEGFGELYTTEVCCAAQSMISSAQKRKKRQTGRGEICSRARNLPAAHSEANPAEKAPRLNGRLRKRRWGELLRRLSFLSFCTVTVS